MNHTKKQKSHRIAVWNTAFLGDAILSLPLLQNLRTTFPDNHIEFWVRKGFASLFESHPCIDSVHEFDKRGEQKGLLSTWKFGYQLGKKNYILWISPHNSLRSAFIAHWSTAKFRIGYNRPWVNKWFYTHTVARRFTELHEVQRQLQLLMPLCLSTGDAWPSIHLPQEAKDTADTIWKENNYLKSPVVGIHPGATWGTKRWPPEYFAQIAINVLSEGGNVVIFGGQGEESMVEQTISHIINIDPTAAGKYLNLAGKVSLTELAACLARLSCYLTNDSGPMHLAWAQHTPVTALFGPTTQKLGFAPQGDASTVMEIPLACRPCSLHGPQTCPLGHHDCMRKLTPHMVWEDVRKKMYRAKEQLTSQSNS